MSTVLQKFLSLLFTALFYIWSGLVSAVMLLVPLRWRASGARLWAHGTLALLSAVTGLKFEFRGLENIPAGPAIFASKHQSAWDTIIFWVLLPRPAFVLKKELLSIPAFGQHLKALKMIPIDRSAGGAGLRRMVKDCLQAISDKRQIVIFPEGTRTPPGSRGQWNRGVAAIYSQGKVPLVPVALNSGLFWGRNSYLKRRGVIVLEVLPPIPPGQPSGEAMDEVESRSETASERLRLEAEERFFGGADIARAEQSGNTRV